MATKQDPPRNKKNIFSNHPPLVTTCLSLDKAPSKKLVASKDRSVRISWTVLKKKNLRQSSDTLAIGEIRAFHQHFRGHHRHECGDLPADLWKCQIRGLWHIKFFRVYFSEIHQQLFQQFTLKFQDHGNSHRKLTGLWAIRRKSTRRRSFVDKTPRFDLKGTCLSAPPNRCRKHVQLTSCFFSGAGSAYVPGVCW